MMNMVISTNYNNNVTFNAFIGQLVVLQGAEYSLFKFSNFPLAIGGCLIYNII